MRTRVLLISVIALFVAGSAGAAPSGKTKLVRVVRHRGAITATLTYRDRTGVKDLTAFEYSDVRLTIRKAGRLVARHQICNVGVPRNEPHRCEWEATALKDIGRGFRITRFGREPLVDLEIWIGCADEICFDSFMAHVASGYVTWVTHRWLGAGYRIERIRDHQYFSSYDGRFKCAFSSCCCGSLPIRIWSLDDEIGLLDVTSEFPARVRADARTNWNAYLADHRGSGDVEHGVGILAAWCADEYLLHKGRSCQHVLRRPGYLTRAGVRAFNNELQKLGYEPRPFRVVKRHGAITATLRYTVLQGIVGSTMLSVRRGGVLLVQHRMCPDSWPREECRWFALSRQSIESHDAVTFRRLSPSGPLAVVQSMNDTGGHCCVYAFAAVLSARPHWVQHNFDWGYTGRRSEGRYYFASGDSRFACTLSSCADTWLPAQIWVIRGDSFVNVTRSTPALVAADARRAWRWYLKVRHARDEWGVGILGGWCADEYLLGRGARCQRALEYAFRHGYLKADGYHGRQFIRRLNRHLERWGYKGR